MKNFLHIIGNNTTRLLGFTLIEMLVGVALLGFLVASQMQIIQTVLNNYREKQKTIQTLDDQVFLSDIMSSHQLMLNAISGNIQISSLNNRVRIARTVNTENRNCLGTLVDAGSTATDDFFLENNEFKCRSQYVSNSVAHTDSQPLVANIKNLAVRWGVSKFTSSWDAIAWSSAAPNAANLVVGLNFNFNFFNPVPLAWESIDFLYVYPLQSSDYLDVLIAVE